MRKSHSGDGGEGTVETVLMIKNHKNQFINQPNMEPVKKSEKSTGSLINQAYYQSTNGKAWLGVLGFMCSRHTLGLLLLKTALQHNCNLKYASQQSSAVY